MRTRSKTESRPYEWTTVPVLVKIFKVIINELSDDMEAVGATPDTNVSNMTLPCLPFFNMLTAKYVYKYNL